MAGWIRTPAIMALVTTVAVTSWAVAQSSLPHMGHAAATPAPIRTTMEDLHAHGGVPSGWTFLLPTGDAERGRRVFVSLECFACHRVEGEDFPRAAKTPAGTGPDLTDMGGHHPAEYFAESILNPNRVIVLGPDFTGPDGLSRMPDYSDSLTIRQLVDLVAYLKSRTGDAGHAGMHHKM